jgi:hypothetical protein
MAYTISLPAITVWQRLEPRPRSDRLGANLAAQIRDPLWLLTRQWQSGELTGADAGSPAFVSVNTTSGGMNGVSAGGGAVQPYDPNTAPLEPRGFSEPFSPRDLSLQAEVGQVFRDLIDVHFAADLNAADRIKAGFLALHSVATDPSTDPFDPLDGATRRFAAICGAREIDGVAVYLLGGVVPPGIGNSDTERGEITIVLGQLTAWVEDVWGKIGNADSDPAGWVPKTLTYDVNVSSATPSGGTATLPVALDALGDAQWSSFDVGAVAAGGGATTIKNAVAVPVRVRFPGMPSLRFWDFESSEVAFPSVHPELRDLVKLLALDFMLVHGQDWFVIPLAQKVGTLSRIDSLKVTDVFGRVTAISRADTGATAPGLTRWTAFTNTVPPAGTSPGTLGDFYLATPSAASGVQGTRVLEQVRFARDEMANMAFAIELLTPDSIGQARRGGERAAAVDVAFPVTPPKSDDTTSPLQYLVESNLPAHYVPLVGVPIDNTSPAIILEKAAHVRSQVVGNTTTYPVVTPASKIMKPTPAPQPTYQIVEEEVPRSGMTVERVVHRARWIDGSTHLWIARRRRLGGGEVASGLTFDAALDVTR